MGKHPWDKWNLGERPKDEWDRISSNGYLGKMQSKFNVEGGFGVYVIELNSDVWEESIRRNSGKRERKWIPSFPKELSDPKEKGNISDDWKELDFDSIEGFLYVGQTWIGQKDGNYFGFEKRHKEHCGGGVKSSPVVLNHGCAESKFWPIERCLTGLDLTETSLMVESWYGWALGQCGYVVYGPDFHRTYKRFGKVYEDLRGFLGQDPFW